MYLQYIQYNTVHCAKLYCTHIWQRRHFFKLENMNFLLHYESKVLFCNVLFCNAVVFCDGFRCVTALFCDVPFCTTYRM